MAREIWRGSGFGEELWAKGFPSMMGCVLQDARLIDIVMAGRKIVESPSMDLLTKDSDHDLTTSMVDQREDIPGEESSRNSVDHSLELQDRDGGIFGPTMSSLLLDGDIDIGPLSSLEFESHEAAYKFYQEYATSMGFTTSIKNSRRSKKSKEFIDAKFACSRYGVTPESDASGSRRPSFKKTDCKASMHVKRSKSGKWIIHEFIKEHNHELLPALAYHFRIHRNMKLVEKNNIDILHAVSERTKKMYVEMSRQSAGLKNLVELSEEGSLTQETYNIALRALADTLKQCVVVNNSNNGAVTIGNFTSGSHDVEEGCRGNITLRTGKKKNAVKKRKVPSETHAVLVAADDSMNQMENLSSGGISLNGYYGSQQNVQGLVQLNLMEPPHDSYYVDQESMQGLGQLNSLGINHGGFFGAQQSVHGLIFGRQLVFLTVYSEINWQFFNAKMNSAAEKNKCTSGATPCLKLLLLQYWLLSARIFFMKNSDG
ncbi:hypothetical protein Cgig2_029647 [Carnegiea gigantea]|uniref:FAR1 domain-containing protein n=1 Tax=Carnegiea gigantea TaxID=171969 RepID=A0A9Q1QIS2_9CARY|nr:hypothetical protein Cgig2_029647 [Carnegiea gigantea]